LIGLRERRLFKALNSHHKKLKGKIERERINDDNFRRQTLYSEELLNYYSLIDDDFSFEAGRMGLLEYDSLLYLYRLTLFCIRKTSVIVAHQHDVLDYILKSIDIEQLYFDLKNSKIVNKGIFKLLLSLILLQKTQDEKLYNEIKEFSFSYSEKFNKGNIFIGYHYLREYIAGKIDKGHNQYLKERYSIYKKLEHDYHNKGGLKITFVDFDNFIKSSIANKDLSWAKYLVGKYIGELEEKGNWGLGNYYNALILFHEKKFDQALSALAFFNLNRIILDEFFLIRDLRTLILQIYFEKGLIDEAFYFVDSFYHYLKNNPKVTERNKLLYGNFLKYYKELINIVSKETYSQLRVLKKNVLEDRMTEKQWILEKIDYLEGKYK
jgi:hypothetical protein